MVKATTAGWQEIIAQIYWFRGEGVLGILNDGDKQEIFMGFKFSIPGVFCGKEKINLDGIMNKQTQSFNF